MSDDDAPRPTVEPYLTKEQEAAFERLLPLPPAAANMPVGSVLARRIQYWGLRAVWEAYQYVIMAGTAARRAVEDAYRADRALQEERERWKNIDNYRKAAAKEADIVLLEVNNRLLQSQLEHDAIMLRAKQLQEENKAFELEAKIATEKREAEYLRAQRQRLEEQKKLAGLDTDDEQSSVEERLQQIEAIIEKHQLLQTEREKLIERYGEEANIPAALLNFLDQLEDEIGSAS